MSRRRRRTLPDDQISVLKRLADRRYILENGRTALTAICANLLREAEQVHRHVSV
jgi:ABC-type branched-subunit amino acid transport system ATPase component